MGILVKLLLLVSLTTQVNALNLNKLSLSQYKVLATVYKQSADSKYQLTLLAIAWKESDFGRMPINISDPSGGFYHNKLSSVCVRLGLKVNDWNRSRVMEKLLFDPDFAYQQALAELTFWNKYWSKRPQPNISTWRLMVSSYNGGTKYTRGTKYMLDIVERIALLKIFIKKNEHILEKL